VGLQLGKTAVCTNNLVHVDEVTESPKVARNDRTAVFDSDHLDPIGGRTIFQDAGLCDRDILKASSANNRALAAPSL
jgi:hypothetical protein